MVMKIIKVNREEYKVTHIDYSIIEVYDEEFEDIRKNRDEKYDECFICEENFDIGDKVALLFMKCHTNKIACKGCADNLGEAGDIFE